jgi:cysteine-rich repeat protein
MSGAGLVARVCAAAVIVIAVAPTRASAHGQPVDLSVWGNFGARTARCQRTIARAAAYCVGRVLAVRNDCLAEQLAGNPCDQDAADDRVEAVRLRAASLVARDCNQTDLQLLRYVDLGDAQSDVVSVCRGLDVSTHTASYGPVLIGGTVAQADESEQACLTTAGRTASRLLRFAMRARGAALDEIAATTMTLAEKQAVLERSTRAIARVRELGESRILARCSAADFNSLYGRSVGAFLDNVAARGDCLGDGVYVQNAVVCPPAVCGDGMQVMPNEECDDGNDYEGDGCRSDCVRTECEVFPTTYDMIQKAIFENRGCTSAFCHDGTPGQGGGLDLRAGVSYENLIDVPAGSLPDSGWKRVTPGDKDGSLLWINLAAATLPGHYSAPLRAMPIGLPPITTDELEALRIWIETAGATRDANVAAATTLLNACGPEPEPVKIQPLPPPAPGTGLQLHMPAWTLAPESESEVCFSSYYDFTGQVPAEFLSADGESFRYKSVEIRQDPLSHHLIINLFRGEEAPNDPLWGVYTCKGGDKAGEVCDPLQLGFCGAGDCATEPDASSVLCVGFGPQTGLSTITRGGLAFAQETTANFRFPGSVYDELPLKGVLLWNSHAFNLTRKAGTLEGWVNIIFPKPDEQEFQQQQIFDASRLFWNDFPNLSLPALAPFEDMEVCQHHEFGPMGRSLLLPGQTAHLFELSSHTHQRGVRFQTFRGRFSCKGGVKDDEPCSPFEAASMCPAGVCTDDGGRDPQAALLYTNFIYNDPLVLRFDDAPILFDGDAPREDRTLTFCGHYDNGKEPNIQNVKRRSTSPPAGEVEIGGLVVIPVGGPCEIHATRCIGGPHHNELCRGDHSRCDSSPGAGDGDCDACPLTGGFRTQDEMFILFGNYWVTDD